MKRNASTLAVLAMFASAPALAQQSIYSQEVPSPMDQLALAPVQDVVIAVEQRLQQLGYDIQPDGQFDADLRNSVILYQSDHGLRPTGNVDLSTLAQMGIDVGVEGQFAAMAPETAPAAPQQTAAAPIQAAPARTIRADWRFPILRDEHMDAPQVGWESQLELVTGVQEPWNILLSDVPEPGEVAQVPGVPAGTFY